MIKTMNTEVNSENLSNQRQNSYIVKKFQPLNEKFDFVDNSSKFKSMSNTRLIERIPSVNHESQAIYQIGSGSQTIKDSPMVN